MQADKPTRCRTCQLESRQPLAYNSRHKHAAMHSVNLVFVARARTSCWWQLRSACPFETDVKPVRLVCCCSHVQIGCSNHDKDRNTPDNEPAQICSDALPDFVVAEAVNLMAAAALQRYVVWVQLFSYCTLCKRFLRATSHKCAQAEADKQISTNTRQLGPKTRLTRNSQVQTRCNQRNRLFLLQEHAQLPDGICAHLAFEG